MAKKKIQLEAKVDQIVDLDDTVAQHENRIKKLEHKAKA